MNIKSALLIFCGIGFALTGNSYSVLAEGPSLPAVHFAPPVTQSSPATTKNKWRPATAKSVALKSESQSVKQTALSKRRVAQQQKVEQKQAQFQRVYSPVTHVAPQAVSSQTVYSTTASQPVYHAYAMPNEISTCVDGSCDSCESCEEESAFKKYCKRRWPGKNCWERWVTEPWRKAYAVQPASCCESRGWYKYE